MCGLWVKPITICVVCVPSCRSQNWCYSFFGVLSDWLACFLALTWPRTVSRVATVGSIVVGITASFDAANNWAFFLLYAIPVFSPWWLLLWCSFLLNCSWHLPFLFLCKPSPTLLSCDWLAAAPGLWAVWVAGLTSSCVVIRAVSAYLGPGGAADEVKQLAPVWSSKHRHAPPRDMKGGRERVVQNKSVWETQYMERWQRDREWDGERVRQIDPLIMDRPLEMPNGEWSLQAYPEWCDETMWYTASQRCKRDNKSIMGNN